MLSNDQTVQLRRPALHFIALTGYDLRLGNSWMRQKEKQFLGTRRGKRVMHAHTFSLIIVCAPNNFLNSSFAPILSKSGRASPYLAPTIRFRIRQRKLAFRHHIVQVLLGDFSFLQ